MNNNLCTLRWQCRCRCRCRCRCNLFSRLKKLLLLFFFFLLHTFVILPSLFCAHKITFSLAPNATLLFHVFQSVFFFSFHPARTACYLGVQTVMWVCHQTIFFLLAKLTVSHIFDCNIVMLIHSMHMYLWVTLMPYETECVCSLLFWNILMSLFIDNWYRNILS